MNRTSIMSAVVACACCGSVLAGPPSIRELRPWGAQRGQTVTLTIIGDQLEPGAELFSAVPGQLKEDAGSNAGQLNLQLQIQPDAAIGVYPIRLRTTGGLSNVLLFSVGDLPEITETEPNDAVPAMNPFAVATTTAAPAVLPAITLPATINGTAPGADQDVFRFSGKKGDRIVLEVEAQRIGSQLDPAIHLVSSSGRELSYGDDTPGLGLDCRLDTTLPDDGDYFVVVHDSKFAGASPAYYRLKAGALAYAESVFPLGAQRGRELEVTWRGGTFGDGMKTKMQANSTTRSNRMFMATPGTGPQGRLPFRLVLGDVPELLEPDSESIDDRWFKDAGVLNGRIAKPGEIDRYKFPVAAGQVWIFEVEAGNLGSALDAYLSVANPQGNVLAAADDGNGLDPRVQITVPAGIDHVVLSVEDLHRRGGSDFAYRLIARQPRADFSLQVLPATQQPPPGPGPIPLGAPAINIPRAGIAIAQVNVVRDGYNGPIQLSIPESTPGITAEDGMIPAGANSGLLVLSASADLALHAFDLEVRGQGGAAAKPIVRDVSPIAAPFAMSSATAARVPAAVTERAPASFSVAESAIKIVHGHNRTLKISTQRGPAATEAIQLNGIGLPLFVVGGTSGTIAKEANEIVLTLNCSPENPVVGTFSMQLQATTQVAGRQELIQMAPVRVDLVRPFSLEVLSQPGAVTVGSKIRIAAVLRREAPFDGIIKVGPAGSLPQHVSLSTVDVPKGESLALLELEVGDSAAPAELDIPIRASTDMEGRKRDKDYVIPDTTLKIKITAKSAP